MNETNPYANKGTHYSMFGRDFNVSQHPNFQLKLHEIATLMGGKYVNKEQLAATWKELSRTDKIEGIDGAIVYPENRVETVQTRYFYQRTWRGKPFQIRVKEFERQNCKADLLITLYLDTEQTDADVRVTYYTVTAMQKILGWLTDNEAARTKYGKTNATNERNAGGQIHYYIPISDIHPPYIMRAFLHGLTIDGVWRAREDHTIIPLCDLI